VAKWKKKFHCKLKVEESSDFSVLQNEIYDEKGTRLDA